MEVSPFLGLYLSRVIGLLHRVTWTCIHFPSSIRTDGSSVRKVSVLHFLIVLLHCLCEWQVIKNVSARNLVFADDQTCKYRMNF
jgi:hypothetical protein